MTTFLFGACVVLLLGFTVATIRLWRGPTPGDRLVVVQLFGTTAVALLVLMTAAVGDMGGLDTALLLSLLGAVTGLALVQADVTIAEDRR